MIDLGGHIESQRCAMNPESQLVMTSVRLQSDLHEQLRRIAFENKRSMHSLLIEGARTVAAKNQSPPQNPAE